MLAAIKYKLDEIIPLLEDDVIGKHPDEILQSKREYLIYLMIKDYESCGRLNIVLGKYGKIDTANNTLTLHFENPIYSYYNAFFNKAKIYGTVFQTSDSIFAKFNSSNIMLNFMIDMFV